MLTNRSSSSKVLSLLTLIAVLYLLFVFGSIKPAFSEDNFTIKTIGYQSTTIALNKITNVELVDNWDKGSRNFGIGTPKVSIGEYSNSLIGKYKLYIMNKIPKYIVVNYLDSNNSQQILVFNCQDEDLTVKWYNSLQSEIR